MHSRFIAPPRTTATPRLATVVKQGRLVRKVGARLRAISRSFCPATLQASRASALLPQAFFDACSLRLVLGLVAFAVLASMVPVTGADRCEGLAPAGVDAPGPVAALATAWVPLLLLPVLPR